MKKRLFQYKLSQLFALMTGGALFYGVFRYPIHCTVRYICNPASWELQPFLSPFYIYYWSMGFEWPYETSIIDIKQGPAGVLLWLSGVLLSFLVAGFILCLLLHLFWWTVFGQEPPWSVGDEAARADGINPSSRGNGEKGR